MDDAANQVLGFNKEVFDTTANLYVHARYSINNEKMPHWSRANGWGIWSTTEVLMHLPKEDDRYSRILEFYRKHTAALATLQAGSGLWKNVLDSKNSPEEVSGTAIFVMAMARGIRLGWIDKKTYLPIVLKGWNALKKILRKMEPFTISAWEPCVLRMSIITIPGLFMTMIPMVCLPCYLPVLSWTN